MNVGEFVGTATDMRAETKKVLSPAASDFSTTFFFLFMAHALFLLTRSFHSLFLSLAKPFFSLENSELVFQLSHAKGI